MTSRHRLFTLLLALAPIPALVPIAHGETADEPALFKAYYLEKEAKDFAAARKLYESLKSDGSAEAQTAAKAGAARCRDHLASENFASLMPPDAMAYAELTRPGQILEKLCGMLGIAGKDMQAILAKRPSGDSKAYVHVPGEFAISPSLFEALNGFGGAAIAITNFNPDEDRPPTGVMVIHHGDVLLLKGLLETAFQFAPTAERVRDMPTFGTEIEGVKITGVLTEALLVVGTERELVDSVIGRLVNSDSDSLATRKDLGEVMTQRRGSTIFGYVDIQKALQVAEKHMSESDRREFNTINAIADLRSLRWATFSYGIHEGMLSSQMAVRLADDHRSIAYNLMRLPPMTRKCLNNVPKNAAAVFGLGLNPELANMALKAGDKRVNQGVTGFDLGREFFGNIQEICAFIVPGQMTQGKSEGGPQFIPNVGIVLSVNDVARSRALWDQVLAIPGLVAGREPIQPTQVKIGETEATAYRIPDFGQIYMAELDGCIAIGITKNALKAAITAHESKDNILKDEILGKALAGMPQDTSIMLAAHIGRCANVATGTGIPEAAMAGQQIAQFCKKMVVCFAVEQAPNQFSIRTSVSGLPNLNEVLKQYGPMLSGLANMAAPVQARQTRAQVAVQEARDAEQRARNAEQEARAAHKALENQVKKVDREYD